jgi:hypothetical protein
MPIAVILFIILGIIVFCMLIIPEKKTLIQPFTETPKIVVSLTTSPQRLKHIKPTLDRIYHEQTLKPDIIELNIPYVFKRNNSMYDLQDLPYKGESYISINRTEDLGPATKFIPTLQKYKNQDETIIIVIDDDIQYSEYHIEELVNASKEHPNMIVTPNCNNTYYTHEIEKCGLIEGYWTYLIKPKFFDNDFYKYINEALKNIECYKGDDFVISNWIHRKEIPIYHIQSERLWVKPFEFGLQYDALHKQVIVDERQRYCGCHEYLDKKDIGSKLHAICPIHDVHNT